jgi:hypothetical protein
MNYQTQLEIDFIEWLRELSADVQARYSRHFENEDGQSEEADYCVECVDAVQEERLASGNEFSIIDGWNDAHEQDSAPHCEKCGCLLEFSPTQYCIDNEIEWLEQALDISADDSEIFLRVMQNFHRETEWPMIAPHAERLMRAAGREIVPDGFITYTPHAPCWFYKNDTAWLSIYWHFAKLLVKWMKETREGEHGFLVDTTGINVHSFQSMTSPEQAKTCVEKLMDHAGENSKRGKFLASIGIASREDLLKPVRVIDTRCVLPTFDVRGRVFRKSPNQFHPQAVIVTHSEMFLDSYASRWVYRLFYSYTHYERTTWCVDIVQQKNHSMQQFCDMVKHRMSRLLVEVGFNDQFRADRLKQWDLIRASLDRLFRFHHSSDAILDTVTDAFAGIGGEVSMHSKLKVTPAMQKTLLKWIERQKGKS